VGAEPDVHAKVEQQRERDPDTRPDQGFSDLDHVRLAMEHAEIECQHGQHEHREADPERGRPDRLYGHALAPVVIASCGCTVPEPTQCEKRATSNASSAE